jgi:uncharacterized protein YlxP (DUF503 family)
MAFVELSGMTIGVLTFELHLAEAGSLKSKRQVMRRIKDRLRARFNVAVSELEDHSDRWQRGEVAVVSVASRRDSLEVLFEAVVREAESHVPGHLVETGREFLEGADGGPSGWTGDW